MKKTLFFLLIAYAGFAQKVKLKNHVLSINNVECFNYESKREFDFVTNLEGKPVLLINRFFDDRKLNYIFSAVTFYGEKKVRFSSYELLNLKRLVKFMVSENVISCQGYNTANATIFADKYNDYSFERYLNCGF